MLGRTERRKDGVWEKGSLSKKTSRVPAWALTSRRYRNGHAELRRPNLWGFQLAKRGPQSHVPSITRQLGSDSAVQVYDPITYRYPNGTPMDFTAINPKTPWKTKVTTPNERIGTTLRQAERVGVHLCHTCASSFTDPQDLQPQHSQ